MLRRPAYDERLRRACRAAQNWARVSPLTPPQGEIAETTALGPAVKQIGEEGLRHRRWPEPGDRAA